jgi:hypothetical protein
MSRKLEAFFSPSVTLHWRAGVGSAPGSFRPDFSDYANTRLLRQFLREAGLDDKNSLRVYDSQLDALGAAASSHGYSLCLVGGPEDEGAAESRPAI